MTTEHTESSVEHTSQFLREFAAKVEREESARSLAELEAARASAEQAQAIADRALAEQGRLRAVIDQCIAAFGGEEPAVTLATLAERVGKLRRDHAQLAAAARTALAGDAKGDIGNLDPLIEAVDGAPPPPPPTATFPITGLWLRTVGSGHRQRVQVLVEHGGAWRLAIDEATAGEIGHIVEVAGLAALPPMTRCDHEAGRDIKPDNVKPAAPDRFPSHRPGLDSGAALAAAQIGAIPADVYTEYQHAVAKTAAAIGAAICSARVSPHQSMDAFRHQCEALRSAFRRRFPVSGDPKVPLDEIHFVDDHGARHVAKLKDDQTAQTPLAPEPPSPAKVAQEVLRLAYQRAQVGAADDVAELVHAYGTLTGRS